jgi:hypothetical protein
MDPNPKTFPILSYVMSKLPSMRGTDSVEVDIEQPSSIASSTSKTPYFELTEQMPHLNDPEVIKSMRLAVTDVAQTRSMLEILGQRPDHETVDIAKDMIAKIDAGQLGDDAAEAEKERQIYKAVISLDEMHEEYEKLLKTAEEKLEKIYIKAAEGGGEVEEKVEVADGVRDEVISILQEASKNGVAEIDLSSRRLLFLPEAFGKFGNLRVFNLSSNQLEVIPDSIAGLNMLEEFNLSSNLLQSLPDSIGLLLNLKILNVSGNKLTFLPDSICNCSLLVELDAGFNKLSYLPTNIGYKLVNLKKLLIPLNKIRGLPTSIGEMISLQILDAHFNELHGLPASIGRLTNLETLNLSSNFSDLKELPETIGELTNLKDLDLSNNQIHALPATFGRLDSLVNLNVDQNPLVIPPNEVVELGVEAVKDYMQKRWLDLLLEEEKKSMTEEKKELTEAGWLTRSTSWLGNTVSGVSGYLGSFGKPPNADPFLNEAR